MDKLSHWVLFLAAVVTKDTKKEVPVGVNVNVLVPVLVTSKLWCVLSPAEVPIHIFPWVPTPIERTSIEKL